MPYSELNTGKDDAATESAKCATSLAVVQILRDRNINVMELVKFGSFDFMYSKFIENQDKLLGIPLPKLSQLVSMEDATANDLIYTVNKYIYVIMFAYMSAYAGVVKNVSRKQLMEYAYAYGLRALAGYTLGNGDGGGAVPGL